MPRKRRQDHELEYREQLRLTVERWDALRAAVMRQPADRRADLERALDELRGLCNRAEARLEDLRRAPEDAWEAVAARAAATLEELQRSLGEVEHRLGDQEDRSAA